AVVGVRGERGQAGRVAQAGRDAGRILAAVARVAGPLRVDAADRGPVAGLQRKLAGARVAFVQRADHRVMRAATVVGKAAGLDRAVVGVAGERGQAGRVAQAGRDAGRILAAVARVAGPLRVDAADRGPVAGLQRKLAGARVAFVQRADHRVMRAATVVGKAAG